MKRKVTGLAFGAMLFALCVPVGAQQPGKVPRIGYLEAISVSTDDARLGAFREGLRELGYVEGKSVVIELRSAEGERDRLPALAAELVRLKVKVIVTAGSSATGAAKKATTTTPIVMAQDSDPIGSGIVASLARPGGNITGLSTLAPEISGKQLDLLKEVLPKVSRVAVLGTSTRRGNAEALGEVERAAIALGLTVQYIDILTPKEIETGMENVKKANADGVLVLAGRILISHRKQVVELLRRNRHPAIYAFPQYVEAGGLMSYGVRRADLFRRAATYVDKILKGAKPGNLPIEQPTKFELLINLKTAKQMKLTIPESVLFRADRVIK